MSEQEKYIVTKCEMLIDYLTSRRGKNRNCARLSEVSQRLKCTEEQAQKIITAAHARNLIIIHESHDPFITINRSIL